MIRRLMLATLAALIGTGLLGLRPGRAQQPAPSAPAPAPSSLPEPGGPPPVDPGDAPAPIGDLPAEPGDLAPVAPEKVDDDLMRVQAPGGEANPLPPAQVKPGDPAVPAGAPPDPQVLPVDRLPLGESSAAVTVEVKAPANANVNRPMLFRILVKNTGKAPAMGVTVYDRLPDGLKFEKSEPPASVAGPDGLYVWQLDTLPVGSEKVISVTAVPQKTGDFDHAPTVTIRTGSRARTLVKQPKLKVEVTHSESADVLKGKAIRFDVRVRNTGTGPARSVVVHANLSAGLKHESGTAIEVAFKDYLGREFLGPGESESIPLEVDTIAGGDQACSVYAESVDVEDGPEAHAESKVRVVEPLLVMQMKGPRERRTDGIAPYVLEVHNPGTATARKVVAAAFLPLDGKLLERTPTDTTYEPKTRRIYWKVGDLEPGARKEMRFDVQLGGVSLFKVEGRSRAEGCPDQFAEASTHVVGMADVDCQFYARTKIMDVGEEPTFEIRLANRGSKAAENVLVKATLPPNLVVVEWDGVEGDAKSTKEQPHDAIFPPINLPAGARKTLTLKVRATASGTATSTVTVTHGEFTDVESITTKVSDPK